MTLYYPSRSFLLPLPIYDTRREDNVIGFPSGGSRFCTNIKMEVTFFLKKYNTKSRNVTANIFPNIFLMYSRFPGSQPVSFEKKHLTALEEEDYYVCEKSDGVRYLLYFVIPPTGPVAFLVSEVIHSVSHLKSFFRLIEITISVLWII